ncbi:hypothetical protein VHEMI06350 [[Torrubiella] hemipterigena]|uniref:Uncharacterized protein n=1 Tax=[Torrubiella] hemipterigena TaxID=1531966 RepID=A0A0A1T0B9_9HYPO|nr:hypothetical protein VHEMI06350 [[Torrubiella] hemipterigena]
MALTIKQLSSDSAFLLTLEPIQPESVPGTQPPRPFRILLDPWITPAKKSVRTNHQGLCINSILDIPEPDLIIISSKEDDHCNEQTLKTLPRRSSKMMILGDAQVTKRILSWNHFDPRIIRTMEPWQSRFMAQKKTKGDNILRIPVPSPIMGGACGEVTVALLVHKKEAAIGITYLPPKCYDSRRRSVISFADSDSPISPTATSLWAPRSSSLPRSTLSRSASDLSTRRKRPHSRQRSVCLPALPSSVSMGNLRASRSIVNLDTTAPDRGVSVIFSPHGIPYSAVEPYATSHLLAQAVLPLTALLHCFDSVTYPWWSRNTPSKGMSTAQQTASTLGARACISTHDGNKFTRGFFGDFKSPRRTKYDVDDVKDMVDSASGLSDTHHHRRSHSPGFRTRSTTSVKPTEALLLRSGESVTLTSEGVCELEESGSESWDEDEVPPVPPLPQGFYPTPQSSFEWLPGPC